MRAFCAVLLALFLSAPPAIPQVNVYKRTLGVTIANGESLSGIAFIGDASVVAVLMPAAWTAAGLTFQGSTDNVTYYDLFDPEGVEISAVVDVDQASLLEPKRFVGFKYLKVRSGTSAVPVNQGAARTLTLLVRLI